MTSESAVGHGLIVERRFFYNDGGKRKFAHINHKGGRENCVACGLVVHEVESSCGAQ